MDKAVILAAGLGTRMQKGSPEARLDDEQAAVADTGVKALVPMGRPFLDFVLHALADAGFRRICLVIGPGHDALQTYYGESLEYERLEVTFAVQQEPLGTANAVEAAEGFAGDGPFLVINSDNYYPAEALRALRELDETGLIAFERAGLLAGSNIPPERIVRFAILEMNGGYLTRVIEKPSQEVVDAQPEPICVSMNCWRFDAGIFPACRAISPSPRGEFEVPDAVQYAIDEQGQRFRALTFNGPVLDLTSRTDVAAVEAKLSGVEVRL